MRNIKNWMKGRLHKKKFLRKEIVDTLSSSRKLCCTVKENVARLAKCFTRFLLEH